MITVNEFRGTERFALEKVLGAGSSGTVYQAFDKVRGEKVALKTLKNIDPVEIYRFKNEFRVLADVTHRNLVKLYDLLNDGENWFFTMELVESGTFLEHVRLAKGEHLTDDNPTETACYRTLSDGDPDTDTPTQVLEPPPQTEEIPGLAPPGPVIEYPVSEYNRLVDSLHQLVEGLMHLHRAGKLHCDIKPRNVLVNPDGRVVILDLGVARDLYSSRLYASIKEDVSGTPAYMSPEQARGQDIGPASDWYSVGVMLYEALTGFLPFRGNIMRVIYDKQRLDPRPPSETLADIPTELDELCHGLLSRDPAQRPDGTAILRALGKALPENRQNLMARDTTWRNRFLYREDSMNALGRAFQRACSGKTSALMLHGAGGMGKTSIVARFLEQLAEKNEDLILLNGRVYQRESVPYKALDSLVDVLSAYLKQLPPKEARALIPADVLVLTRLFPVLGRVHAIANADRGVLSIPDSREQRRRAFTAWRELFRNLGRRGKVVLFIDDLQWGDRDSALLLNELLRPPSPPRMLFIGCYPTQSAATSPMLHNLLSAESLGDDAVMEEVVVGELRRDEAETMALWLLGEDEPYAQEIARTLARESGGCPFLIEALARYARTIAMDDTDSAGHLNLALGSATVEKVIAYQLNRVSVDARRLMALISLAGQPVDPEALGQAAELSSTREALSALHVHRLIRTRHSREGEMVECYHNRVREAVLSQMSEKVRRGAHLILAQALQTSAASRPETLANHFRDAGDARRASELTVKAANQAAEALAFDRAAQLYRMALDLETVGSRRRPGLRTKLAEALANAGRGFEAGNAYLEAAGTAASGESLELRRRAAEQYLVSGHVDKGLTMAAEVLRSIGMEFAQTPRKALVSLLLRRIRLKFRGVKFAERAADTIPPEHLIRIDTCWSMAVGLGMADTIRGMDFSTRHLLLALDSGEPYRVGRALAIEAGYSATAGSKAKKRTESLLLTAGELVERVNNPHAHGLVRMIGGVSAFLEGRWRAARERCGRAEQILRDQCTGVTWEVDTAVQFLMRALIFLGEFRLLAERYPALLKDNRERGDLYAEINLMTCVSWLVHLIEDRPVYALSDLEGALKRWSQQGFHLQHYWIMSGRAAIDMYNGDGGRAWDRIQEPWAQLERSMLLRIQFTRLEARHLRARCALAALSEEQQGTRRFKMLVGVVKDEIRAISKEDLNWSNPLANLLNAGLACVTGDKDKSLKLLARAVPGFENADMALYRAAAVHRRGKLMGESGRNMVLEAEALMTAQRIKCPDRMTDVLAPGFPEAEPA
ncbi:MAG: protein kinase [Acidobacteriota bacterium]|nr:protein kinase [Acidobacteriota bacterium]